MDTLQKPKVTDSRETVETEAHYATFDYYIDSYQNGTITWEEAIEAYRKAEIGELAVAGA